MSSGGAKKGTQHRSSLRGDLSRQVVKVLTKHRVSREEVMAHGSTPDLPWQAPPLQTDAMLGEIPMSMYFETPLEVNIVALYRFWNDAVRNYFLQHKLSTLFYLGEERYGVWRGYRSIFSERLQQKNNDHLRAFYLTLPDGYTLGELTHSSIYTFTIECVNIARLSGSAVVQTDDDFYVQDMDFGIKDGRLTHGDRDYLFPVNGMINQLLRSPRGEITPYNEVSLLSNIRCLMYADYQRFGDDFEGLDLAIQTLWLIKASEMFAPMLKGIVKQNVTRSRDALALSLAHEALDTWKTKGLTDKGKCYALRSILVPDALSQSSFRRMIYSSPVETMPPYLTEEHRKKILGKLQQFVVDMEAKNAN